MSEAMDLEDFLEHKTSGGGDRAFLENWKKRPVKEGLPGPHIDTWLHTRSQITAVWSHPWPRLVERKGQDPGDDATVEVWSGAFNSWDHPSILRAQYFLDKQADDGSRQNPPQVCPMGLMVDAVRLAIFRGDVDIVAPLFEFAGTDPRKTVTLHAGGIVGAFKGDKLSDDEKKAIKAAGIYLKDAWRESLMGRCSYVFNICDNDHPEKGVQIAQQGAGLGDAVKTVINEAMDADALGREKGNPLKNPYCIRWIYEKTAKSFADVYQARRLDSVKLSAEVRKAIVDDPPRDIERLTARGNIVELRLAMETHYVGPKGLLDWDALFAPAEALDAGEPDAAATPEVERVKAAQRAPQRPAQTPAKQQAKRVAPEPEPEPEPQADGDEPVFECDECDAPMLASETVCKKCGRDYELHDADKPDPQPEPAKPKPQPRSAAAATTRAAPKAFAAEKPAASRGTRVRG